MKTRTRIIVGAILASPLLLAGTVIAHEVSNGTHSHSGQVAQATTEESQEMSAEDKAALLKRLEERKTALKTRLTATEQQRLKSKCKASQGNLSSLKGRIKGIDTSRANVYRELVERLTKLSGKLKENGVDTAQLDSQIDELKTKIETFKTDLAAYKQAVSDLADMDCVQDPTAFKASLETARTAREKVNADAAAIKAYVKDTIKPTLQQLRSTLEKNESTSGGDQ